MQRALCKNLIVLFAALTMITPVQGQNFGERFLRGIGLGAASKNEKLHDGVLKAFSPVVKTPSKSTVRVLADGSRVAYGAVVDAAGFVLTKASELKGKKKIEIRLPDGKRHSGKLIGIHRPTDLGLVKIDLKGKTKLSPITWAKDDAQVGSWLVTTGVGALPVCIGVASVKPRKIAQRRGLLGVRLREARDEEDGPAIEFIVPNSAAQKIKLKVNDVITHVNGKKVNQPQELIDSIKKYRPGHRVHLRVERNGKAMEKSVELGDFDQIASPNHFQNGLGGPRSKRRGGFETALQHDSFLKPNDCGGPIVNLDGQAVGINIARASRIASYAIPASVIKTLLPKLKAGRYPVSETDAEKLSKLASQLEDVQSKQRRVNARFQAQQVFVKKLEKQLKKAEKAKQKAEIAKAKKKLGEARKDLGKIKSRLDKINKRIADIKDKL